MSALPPPLPMSSSILDGYRPPVGFYDELLDNQGTIRRAWAATAAELAKLGVEGFRQRAEQVRRIVQDNGVTYNAFGDNGQGSRPWVMDPLPMILSHDEWAGLEKGLGQRVNLLNHLLDDIYGEQALLKEGILPPAIVLGNPHFLRPLHGFRPPGGIHVHLYAADLARSPDGRWWVLADRLDTTSGLGYALENRFVTQRALSDVFRTVGPLRLRPFFQDMLESFETLVQRRTEHPMIVLLSPGPGDEAYFEHVFFARNLGYPLVEGADLTTRDQKVFLKTVGGLRQVDVILRSVPSLACDPLELDADSLLGVPGLIQAARAGNVVVANSPGVGIAESPALPVFLPKICERLLGETLAIPSAQTWWCGDTASREHVLAHLDAMVIKPVIRRRSGEAIFPADLPAAGKEALRQRLRANPADYCAQEMVARATVPVLNHLAEAEARHFLLRVFLVARDGRYEMLPGGLTRISQSVEHGIMSITDGGTSKDTWVLARPDSPPRDHPLPHTGPVRLRRSTAELTSRDADNLFWLGRYLERTDFQSRLLRLLLTELRENTTPSVEALRPFLQAIWSDEAVATTLDWLAIERRLADMVWDTSFGNNLATNLSALSRAAYAIRERLSLDASGLLGQLDRFSQPAAGGPSPHLDPVERLNGTLMRLSGIAGTISENMTRALDWHFLELGRRLERAQGMISLLLPAFAEPGPYSEGLLANILVAADSRYTYASRYLTNLQPEAVVDLVLLDATNPRSVAFQAQAVAQHLDHLPMAETEEPQTDRRRLARRVAAELDLANVRELLMPVRGHAHPRLHRLLESLDGQLLALGDLLAQHYFAHADEHSLSSRLD